MIMTRLRRYPAGVLLVFGVLTAAIPTHASGREHLKDASKEGKEKPRLRLVAEPAFGFTPVNVVLTGQLTGVDPEDADFCHAAVTWIRIDPGQTEDAGIRVRENPACLHPKEQVFVPTSFTKTYSLYSPGSYLFRLRVERKNGTRIDSGFVKVEVLRVQ